MAGTIRPNDMNMSTTPTLSSNPLPGLSLQTDLTKKPSAPRTPRVDVEPLYAAVKGAISDADWTTYKKSLSFFLLGNLNQEELSHALSKILTTPALEHAHNALFTAIYANIWRDAPDAGIASWVSSSDKPSSGVVKGTHDESEKRLKYEVMQLSRRERKRLKTIPAADAGEVVGSGVVQEYVEARRAKQPESGPVGGNQGGGFGKTNWDLEIRKRYTSSLFSETHEFPTAPSISHRLLPTCYEFGLPQGHAPDCAEYLNIATETYIKEALMSLLGKVASNGPGYIRTGAFKKRVAREERLVDKGELVRLGSAVELPVEADERRKRKMLCLEDLRLALQLGDGYLGQTPLIAGGIWHARMLDTDGIDDLYTPALPVDEKVKTNGVNGAVQKHAGEVWNVEWGGGGGGPDAMQIDEEGWNAGGGEAGDLDGLLDDVLNLADL
ncbi:transcriptional regulator of RNA polII, SAGA, subunit-domain-containing protein [Paraphoma chrysanthemicola]|uniref:Transcriptional regulator of RNA polII, SAGA, subunit-domain-containing protein n=1 Tax=Paraphoma chrysanthemicola TaxID=798071 RepID=A0A8K0R2B2_9PLEO|nr:transcriptional regulator of RNA polII, SAGA, subunit-domain-containing protein [Paraphoma chrysanthemicola]